MKNRNSDINFIKQYTLAYDKNPQINGKGDESPVLLFRMYL